MNIIEALNDQNLLGHFLGENQDTWKPWKTALRALYGLPITTARSRQLVQECTGRNPDLLPGRGFDTALFLVGRRSGKSRTAACIAAFEAVLAGHEAKLAKGEKGVVPILSPSKAQSRVVASYLRSAMDSPVLRGEVANETQSGFELKSGTRIEILSGDYRTIRGYSLLAAVCDEVAFMGYGEESRIRSDSELIRALRPGLATVGGKLICISSPYARKGWCYDQHKRCFCNDKARTLVWNCASRVMNSTLPQSVVDAAIEEDLQAAKSEYLGEFRDDIAAYISRELINRVVVPGRYELLPAKGVRFVGYVDVSGGRHDDSCCAVAHQEGRKVVVDMVRRYAAPHNPHLIIAQMCEELKHRWGLHAVTGDRYAAAFAVDSFAANGVRLEPSALSKSELYVELMPRICSDGIELLDDPLLISQLASLERRTRSGGKDVIDHPAGGKDDVSNAVAGASFCAATAVRIVGAF